MFFYFSISDSLNEAEKLKRLKILLEDAGN